MNKIKKGDIVGRISYGKDILFKVDKIISLANGKKIAILKGITLRIEADSDLEDLVIMQKEQIKSNLRSLEDKIERCVKKFIYREKQSIEKRKLVIRTDVLEQTGRILHLDGDKKYTDKSLKYYKKMGLDAIVRNISENRQEYVVIDLLNRYKPDILVVTGHDRNG